MLKDVCREHGVALPSYYNWKSKYGGMEASDVKNQSTEGENRRLKTIFADLSLEL
ncbi:transposase [Vibrio sp. Scap24]|nr:transposase [Vibrio sp. Scap16]QLE93208.1 transposase [Vibrio sp. Scap24]